MAGIQYLEDSYPDAKIICEPVKSRSLWGHRPGQSADGYGSKITTDYMVRLGDKRPLRVYATCYSNAASYWVRIGGQIYHLRNCEVSYGNV